MMHTLPNRKLWRQSVQWRLTGTRRTSPAAASRHLVGATRASNGSGQAFEGSKTECDAHICLN